MSGLVAAQALCMTSVRVSAEARMDDVRDSIDRDGATHAVVVDGERISGIVSLRRALLSNSQRIFADLVGRDELPAVAESAALDLVARAMDEACTGAVRVLSSNGDFLGVVTRDSLLRASLEEANRRLDEIRRLRGQQEHLRVLGQMVCGVAHDLNNMLTPVVTELELVLRRGERAGDVPRRLDTALTAARDAAAAIRRLQEFYRGPRCDRVREPTDLRRIATDVRELTRVKWRDEPWSRNRNVDLALELGAVPPVEIGPAALREVLVNLVINAVDAIDGDGVVTIRTRTRGDTVAVEVSDTGRGMGPEEIERCFDPLFTTKGEGGTGLGLSVSREIVEASGGRIEVTSREGEGTAVCISFPATREEPQPERSLTPIALQGLRVLYAEDSVHVRSAVKEQLEQLGLVVDAVAAVDEARELLHGSRYDIVMTDLSMPEDNGLTLGCLAKELRPGIAVLVVTGWSGAALLDDPEAAGCVDAVLEKPFGIDELEAALACLLQHS